MRIDSTLFRGFVNKDLRVTYSYNFEETGKFQTIFQKDNKTYISPSFSISIGGKFGDPRVFIPSSRYYYFTEVLNKTIKLVSEHLFEIFPDIGKIEFEIDERMLERYQTEKAMSSGGITIMPCVYNDATSASFPGIKIETSINDQTMIVPFEDAIAISKMFESFDPHNYGLSMLRIIGKID